MKKILFITIATILGILTGPTLIGFAQEASTTVQTQPQTINSNDLSQEEQLIIRKQILDLFGIPINAPLSIFDVAKGNPFGNKTSLGNPVIPLHDLQIVQANESMTPGTVGKLLAVSAGTNLRQAEIAWYRNGTLEASGIGATLYSFPIGSIGSQDKIRLVVRTKGTTKELFKTINPSRVFFAWSSKGYTPNWYRGKSLPTQGSTILVNAFPLIQIAGKRLSTSELNYEWSVDDKVLSREARGNNSFYVETSLYHQTPYRVSVRVRDDFHLVDHQEFFMLTLQNPDIVFYAKDPLYGLMSNRALSQVNTKIGESTVIQFEPFYSPIEKLIDTHFAWNTNSSVVRDTNSNDRALRLSSTNQSSESLFVSYDNPQDISFRGRSGGISVMIK